MKSIFEKIRRAEYTHLEDGASFSIEKQNGKLYLLFEWSNGLDDWKNNFNFPAKPYRDMENKWHAHRGFLKVWKIIEPHLKDVIMDKETNKIIIAGYSHGAAIAVLCHEYCKYNRPDADITGYGFGCPRVLWGRMSKDVKKRFEGFYVIRNSGDIVTHVPPAIFGFRHVGNLFEIGEHSDYNIIDAHRAPNYKKELELLSLDFNTLDK